MYELYMHDYFMGTNQLFNLVPYMGDIQLTTFTSFTLNQVKWKKAFDVFKENQMNMILVVQVEHLQAVNIFNKHRTFLGMEG